jgi:hypothetical protein
MAFLIFGKRQDRPTQPPGDGSSQSMEP